MRWKTQRLELTANTYELLRISTSTSLSGYQRDVATFAASRTAEVRLGNGAIGAGGELGELFDVLLDRPVDGWSSEEAAERWAVKLVKESGDYLWYLAETARGGGLDIGHLVCRPLQLDPRAVHNTSTRRADVLVVHNGRLLDYLKKVLYHQGAHALNEEKLAGLLTSAIQHFQWLLSAFDLPLDFIAEENFKKLAARYPTGVFRPEDSRNRKEGDV